MRWRVPSSISRRHDTVAVMRNRGGIFALALAVVAVGGCDKLKQAAGGNEAGAGTTTASSTTPAAASAPCIVGRWDAKDLSSKIKSSIKSAQNAGLTPQGGKIIYDFATPGADGKGVVTVSVESFVTKMAMSQSGVNINGTITLSGPAKMPYTNGPADALSIDPPTEGKINAHADVQTSGMVSTRKTEDSAVDLHGAFIYECAADKMTMWNKSSGKQGQALVFARIK